MTRDLTEEETFLLNKFAPLKFKEVSDVTNVNLLLKKGKFIVEDPKVFELSNSMLILGNPQHVIDMDFLKKFLNK